MSRLCPLLAFCFAFAAVFPVVVAGHGVTLPVTTVGHGEGPGDGGGGR